MRDERNMSETCTYSGRDDLLVAYLYDDIESGVLAMDAYVFH